MLKNSLLIKLRMHQNNNISLEMHYYNEDISQIVISECQLKEYLLLIIPQKSLKSPRDLLFTHENNLLKIFPH